MEMPRALVLLVSRHVSVKALRGKRLPALRKKNPACRWPLDSSQDISSSLHLQPASPPCRFWTCQPPQLHQPISLNKSLYKVRDRDREKETDTYAHPIDSVSQRTLTNTLASDITCQNVSFECAVLTVLPQFVCWTQIFTKSRTVPACRAS